MLQYLSIKNLALVEQLTLDLESGFSAVTGETGAGKSIVLGALALLAGDRADKMLIKVGTETCTVEGTLKLNDTLVKTLEKLNLPNGEDGICILSRSFSHTKAPRVQINGALTTLVNLQTLAEHWIAFNGPHDPQRLFKTIYQLQLVDTYGHLHTERERYTASYKILCENRELKETLLATQHLSEDERCFLRHQLDKLQAVNLDVTYIEELEQRYAKLSTAKERTATTSVIIQKLEKTIHCLIEAKRAADNLAVLDKATTQFCERLQSTVIELQDLEESYKHIDDEDAGSDERVENQMNLWLELKRQYGPTVEQVARKRDQLAQQLDTQAHLQERLAAIDETLKIAEQAAKTDATTWTSARQKITHKLATFIENNLRELGFAHARFEICVQTTELTTNGDSTVEFVFSPNAGQPLLPLAKIASSGELARVLLAVQSLLAEADATPVLVFDEIDANVGGEIGTKVGAALKKLAAGRQVLCVTHLPQVAAFADQHYVVAKTQTPTSTHVTLAHLKDLPARTDEIARMLGDRNASSAVAHAKRLLQSA